MSSVRFTRIGRPRGRPKYNQPMARKLEDIAAEALELPLTARAELAGQLLDSLEDISEEEHARLWAEEAERRYSDYKSGKVKPFRPRKCSAAFVRAKN